MAHDALLIPLRCPFPEDQSAASGSVSRSWANWRTLVEGVICGLGGCKIASRPGARQAGKASPRSPQSGSSHDQSLAFLELLAERLAFVRPGLGSRRPSGRSYPMPPQKARLNKRLSRINIIVNKIMTWRVITIDCASANPAMP